MPFYYTNNAGICNDEQQIGALQFESKGTINLNNRLCRVYEVREHVKSGWLLVGRIAVLVRGANIKQRAINEWFDNESY